MSFEENTLIFKMKEKYISWILLIMDRKKSMHQKACLRHLIVCVARNLCILDAGHKGRWITAEFTGQRFKIIYHSRISSVGRVLHYRRGGKW